MWRTSWKMENGLSGAIWTKTWILGFRTRQVNLKRERFAEIEAKAKYRRSLKTIFWCNSRKKRAVAGSKLILAFQIEVFQSLRREQEFELIT